MSGEAGAEELEDQRERTQLAWRRTALSLIVAGLLVGHLAVRDVGGAALAGTLLGVGAVVAFVWLSGGRRIGVAGLVLVAGVVLLGAMGLVGIAAH